MANVRQSTKASLAMLREVMVKRESHKDITIATALATSFGCSIEGAVSDARVNEIVESVVEAGVDEINLADTVGYGDPEQVKRVFKDVQRIVGDLPIAAHFHDTRGLGLANVVAALDSGVRRFDSALGGLGGCPFAPGASGNITTEDTVYLFERLGFDTGIDLAGLLEVRRQLTQWLPNEKLEGKLFAAGPAKR